MNPATLTALADAVVATHDDLIRHTGQVNPPSMIILHGDTILASITLRPITRGNDAALGIVELSTLAAAAPTTDVVLAWEHHDLLTALGVDPPPSPLAINVCWATPTDATLNRYPFKVHVLDRHTAEPEIAVDWMPPEVHLTNPRIPQVIIDTLDYCWQPLDGDYRQTADLMTALGYHVDLTTFDPGAARPAS